jgi:CDP-glucose 4,6-dehydratase
VIRSDGKYIRDYFYVEDGAAAYMSLVEHLAEKPHLRGEAFNFSNERQITVREIVDKIIALMNSHLEPEIRDEITNEILHQYLSAEKAHTVLGWQPLFTLEEGLTRTITWYRDFLREH